MLSSYVLYLSWTADVQKLHDTVCTPAAVFAQILKSGRSEISSFPFSLEEWG
jgi:hypothetical protein